MLERSGGQPRRQASGAQRGHRRVRPARSTPAGGSAVAMVATTGSAVATLRRPSVLGLELRFGDSVRPPRAATRGSPSVSGGRSRRQCRAPSQSAMCEAAL
jgi:hypothetical protein